MRECDLAGAGAAAPAADERGGRRGVVGGAERPAADEAPGDRFAGGGVDAGDLERLGGGQGRQDGAQSPGEHRLAGAGRAAEQQVVAAGGRDLERLAGERQPPHVGEVDQLVVAECRFEVTVGVGRGRVPVGPGLLALQARPELAEGACRPHPHAADQLGLGGVGDGHDHGADPGTRERVDERKGARHRADRAVEAELPEHRDAVEHTGRERVVGSEQTERDRELEPGAGLADAAGGEVDGDAALGPLEAR